MSLFEEFGGHKITLQKDELRLEALSETRPKTISIFELLEKVGRVRKQRFNIKQSVCIMGL